MLETLRPGDPPSLGDLARCRQWLLDFFQREIGPALESRLTAIVRRDLLLVGTGGTTTILARMRHQMADFNRERIEGTRLTRGEVLDYMVLLWSKSLAARKQIPGAPSQPGRCDPHGSGDLRVVDAAAGPARGVREFARAPVWSPAGGKLT